MARDLLKHKFIKNAKKNSILMDLIEQLQTKKKNSPGSLGNSLAGGKDKHGGGAEDDDTAIANNNDAWDFGTVKPAASGNNASNMGTVKPSTAAATNRASQPRYEEESNTSSYISSTVKASQRPQDSFKVPPPPASQPTAASAFKEPNTQEPATFNEIDQILAETAAMTMGGTVKQAPAATAATTAASSSTSAFSPASFNKAAQQPSQQRSVNNRNQNSLDILDLVLVPAINGTGYPVSEDPSDAKYMTARKAIIEQIKVCEKMLPGFSEQLVQGIIQRVDVEPGNN